MGKRAFSFVLLLSSLIGLASAAWGDDQQQWNELNKQVIRAYQEHRYEEAIFIAKQALDLVKRTFGEEHPKTAVAYNNLADLYRVTGRYAAAERPLKMALEIRRKAMGEEHPDTAASYSKLAALYLETGRYAEAEPLCKKALEITRTVLGEERRETAASYNNLAALYDTTARYAEAEPLYKKALEIYRKALGEEHPDTANLYNNLAWLYSVTGRYADAEPLLKKALDIYRKALGEEHPITAKSYNELAVLYDNTGRYTEAEPLYMKSLAIKRKALGEEHPSTAISYTNLAWLYEMTGRHAEAEPLYKKALEINRKALGEEHAETAKSYNNLAGHYCDISRYAEAEPLYKKALEIYRKALGEEHPDTANLYNNLAWLYERTGRRAEAEPLFKKALEIRRKVLGEEHPDTATSYSNLGEIEWTMGRMDDAGRHLDSAFSARSAFLARNLNAGQTGEGMKLLEANTSHFAALTSFNLTYRAAEKAYDPVAFCKGLFFDAASASRRAALADPQTKTLFDDFVRANERLSLLIDKRFTTTESQARAALEAEIKNLQARVAELDTALAGASAAYRTNRDALRADGRAVRAALPAGTALADYFRYRRFDPMDPKKVWFEYRYAAFVVTKDKIQYFDLGDADAIDALVGKVRQRLDPAAVSGGNFAEKEARYKEAASELYGKVFAPLAPALNGFDKIIVSPDGMLSTVPFSVLTDDQGHYLIEKYTLGYAASAREVIRAAAAWTNGKGALLAGDPDFDAGAAGRSSTSAGVAFTRGAGFAGDARAAVGDIGTLRFGRLAETADEVRTVGKAAGKGAQVLLGAAATEAAVKRQAPGREYLYFATHGYFIERPEPAREGTRGIGLVGAAESPGGPVRKAGPVVNPLSLCGLAFAGANVAPGVRESAEDDGLLTGAKVVNLDLTGAKLVVLSACVTGLGEVKSGQGIMGLRYAFTLAGARTVAATSWSVPSDETKTLMERWTPRVLAGEPAAASLRDEQLKLMAEVKQRTGSMYPFFWGAFTVSGRTW